MRTSTLASASDRPEYLAFFYQNKKPTVKVGAARIMLQNIIKRKLGIRICEYSHILRLESELSDLRMENANQNTCERK